MIPSILDGYNVTLFTFGPSGSGKSYTYTYIIWIKRMFGTPN